MAKPKIGTTIFKRMGSAALGSYVPQFIRIHFRYMRHNFRAWAVLFVAPFLSIKLVLSALYALIGEAQSGRHSLDLIAIFTIGLCFFFAERNRKFRRIYVYAVPVIVAAGLLYWNATTQKFLSVGQIVLAALIMFMSLRLYRFSTTKGYEQLTDGADKDYHAARDLIDAQEYKIALPLLEKSSKRGHFKSLYLMGQFYEHGHLGTKDLVQAGYYYLKSGRKGYAPANSAFSELLNKLSPAELEEIEDQAGHLMIMPTISR